MIYLLTGMYIDLGFHCLRDWLQVFSSKFHGLGKGLHTSSYTLHQSGIGIISYIPHQVPVQVLQIINPTDALTVAFMVKLTTSCPHYVQLHHDICPLWLHL